MVLTGPSICHARRPLSRAASHPYRTKDSLDRRTVQCLGSGNIHNTNTKAKSNKKQLAYLEKTEYVHAVAASSDVLIFECTKVITSWDFDARQFGFIRREKCIADLSKFVSAPQISDDIFLDTCILAGTPFLPTLPILDAPNRAELLKPYSAIKMIMSNGQSGYSVVVSNNDVPPSGKEYVTRYQKARLAVKNHPVYTEDGKIEPQNPASIPNDAVQYLGRRLPDEILHYMSKGLISPRILQWRTTGEIFEVPPMDGGDSPEYKNLVSSKLIPLRTSAINLISSSLHNWYRHNDLEQTNWFSVPDASRKLASTTIHVEKPSEAQAPSIVDTWNVKEATFKDAVGQHKVRLTPVSQFASSTHVRTRIVEVSRLPFCPCKMRTLQPKPFLRRTPRTRFHLLPKLCTTQYGASSLYASMWTRRHTT